MAYWYDPSSNNKTSARAVDFECDNESDIQDLPTSTTEGVPQENDTTLHLKVKRGSSCLCIGNSTLYILNSQDEWVEL